MHRQNRCTERQRAEVAHEAVAPARISGGPDHIAVAEIETVHNVGPNSREEVDRDRATLRRARRSRCINERGGVIAIATHRLEASALAIKGFPEVEIAGPCRTASV